MKLQKYYEVVNNTPQETKDKVKKYLNSLDEEHQKLQISQILVDNKYPLKVKKDDVAVHVVNIPIAAEKIYQLIKKAPIHEVFKQWCQETKRSGGILVGSSIKEFFKYYENGQ